MDPILLPYYLLFLDKSIIESNNNAHTPYMTLFVYLCKAPNKKVIKVIR